MGLSFFLPLPPSRHACRFAFGFPVFFPAWFSPLRSGYAFPFASPLLSEVFVWGSLPLACAYAYTRLLLETYGVLLTPPIFFLFPKEIYKERVSPFRFPSLAPRFARVAPSPSLARPAYPLSLAPLAKRKLHSFSRYRSFFSLSLYLFLLEQAGARVGVHNARIGATRTRNAFFPDSASRVAARAYQGHTHPRATRVRL